MDHQRVDVPQNGGGKQEVGPNSHDSAGGASATTPEVMSPPIEPNTSQNASKRLRDETPRETATKDTEQVNNGLADESNHKEMGPSQQGNDVSPSRKRQRGDLPEVVSVSSSALQPPPFSRNPSATLTESSVEEGLDHSEEYRESKRRPLLTPRPQDDASDELMHHSPRASPSQEHLPESPLHMSPSSRTSGPSPLPPPPAPPSTPASIVQTFQDMATPRPQMMEDDYELEMRRDPQHGVMENAHLLEQERNAATASAAATPAPTENRRKKSGPGLAEDFSEWAVGDRYELLRILGRGSYGEVAQARDLHSTARKKEDTFVAIKRITSAFEQEVDAVRLYREMHILRRLRGHECIIQLLDVVQPPTEDLDDFHDLYLVFEYVDTDLYKLIMSPQFLTTEHIQTFLYQMLAGLKYIHSSSVIHRDLKPANILLNEDCSLKICDFGLARIVNESTMLSSATAGDDDEPKDGSSTEAGEANIIDTPVSFGAVPKSRLTRQLTKHVVTRWYRAPELILIQPYSSAVDIWSMGCILAELLSMQEGSLPGYEERQPLFPGGSCYPLSGEGGAIKKDERLDQLSVIFGVIGTPEAEDLDSIGKVTDYVKSLDKQKGTPFESLFPAADPAALDLLKHMLKFNPKKRCTAEEALEHDFLKGVRRKEMEKSVEQPLVGPDFLESSRIDLNTLKLKTYEEVLWYRDQGRHRE